MINAMPLPLAHFLQLVPTFSRAPCWRELAARAYNYRACSPHKEPKALLNSRHRLQETRQRGN